MIKELASVCVAIALTLDTTSYWKQASKILRTKKSTQVSSSSYLYKISKTFFSITGLLIYSNFVGLTMECSMLCVYVSMLVLVIKYKPKKWRLFS